MKYLFIGLGGIGQRHLRNLINMSLDDDKFFAYRVRCEQFVLDDKLQIEENYRLEEKYNLTVFNDLDRALEVQPDVVFICNPTSLHMKTMLKVAKQRCHFFVEKPLSHNMDNLEMLCDLVKNNRIITYVGYQQRYNPCIIKAKEIIDSEILGELISVNAEVGECVKNWHKYEDYKRMYACRRDLGGGVVLSQIHELDYLYYFFGMPISVYAVGGHVSDLEIDVEDVVDILLKYHIKGKNIPVHVHEDYIQTPASRTCKIVGTKGRIEFDLIKAEFIQYNEFGECICNEKYNFERNDMFKSELHDFLECVKNEKESNIPIEAGIQSLKMANASLESLDTGQVVLLN